MSDHLDMLLELQELCLPQGFEKKIDHRHQKLSTFFLVYMSLLLRFGFHMPINSCQTLVNRNPVEEKQQFMKIFL